MCQVRKMTRQVFARMKMPMIGPSSVAVWANYLILLATFLTLTKSVVGQSGALSNGTQNSL